MFKEIETIDDDYDTILKEIIDVIKTYDNYNLVEEKLNIIFNTIKNSIKKIRIYEDDIIIYLYDSYCYGINYDYTNYPMFSFYTESILFNVYDCGIFHSYDNNIVVNLYDINLKNFERIE